MAKKRKADRFSSPKKDKTLNSHPETGPTEETSHLHTENKNPVEATNFENRIQESSNNLPKEGKKSPVANLAVRRSGRIRSLSVSPKPIVSHVNLVEKEEEPQLPQQVSTLPVLSKENSQREKQGQQSSKPPVLSNEYVQGEPSVQKGSDDVHDKKLHEKIDYLVEAVDEFKKIFKPVATRPNESPSSDLSYKSLYIDSQKKVEALLEKNYELEKELEYANGKVAAYEKMKDSSREVILLSNVGQPSEARVQIVQNSALPPAPASASPPAPASASAPALASASAPASAPAPDAADADADADADAKAKKNNHKKKKAKS